MRSSSTRMPTRSRGWAGAAIAAMMIVMIAAATVEARSSLDALLADDSMPYDMSAVEQMERVQQRASVHASAKAQVHAAARVSMESPHIAAPVAQHSAAGAPKLNNPMTEAEQRFFSESDVDSFLQQHQTMQIKLQAQQKVEAKARAEAQAKAAAAAKVAAAARAKAEAEAAVKAKAAAVAAAQARAEAHARTMLDALTETARVAAGVEDTGAPIQVVELEPEEHIQLVEVESDEAPKPAAAAQAKAAASAAASPVLLEQKSTTKSTAGAKGKTASAAASHRSKGSKAWWQSKQGVATNYQHFRRGLQNSLIQGKESITTTQKAYSLDLGKSVASGRINQAKKGAKGGAKAAQGEQAAAQPKGDAPLPGPAVYAPAVVEPPTAPLPASAFNPYTGAPFHPAVPMQQFIPEANMPGYLAESKQPWAGAGYYGSGGGQGPHPGSEAFVPLPGVDGKEFGIRAREAWEAHAAQYKNDPSGFHNPANLPPYPYFPSWSRQSEVGGRPDIFPRPMVNIRSVTRDAQLAAVAAQRHSQIYYPQFNGPIAAEAADLNANPNPGPIGSVPASLASRYIRAPIGYPAPAPQQSPYGPTASSFPQPSNAATFDESVNYAALGKSVTMGVPVNPQAAMGQANIMFNPGPNQGLHPLFGGSAMYVPRD